MSDRPGMALRLRREPLQQSCTTPLSRSSLYPVIGNGFAPDVACFAATAMLRALAGVPCNTASAA